MKTAAILFIGTTSVLACRGIAARPPALAPASTATSADDDDAAAALVEHDRHHHHGGVTLFIAMSIETLGAAPEQRVALERIRSELHATMAPARAAEQTLMTALADGIAANAVDKAAVDADIARLVAAAAARDASADALNELHRVLLPPQRAALIDKVEAHWAVWQRANAAEGASAGAERSHLAALETELGLRPEQINAIRNALGETTQTEVPFDARAVEAFLQTFGDAFRRETFDASALPAWNRIDASVASRGAECMANLIEAVGPVLTADQRADFAEELRKHATHNPSAESNL